MITIHPRRTGGRWYLDGPEVDSLPYYFNTLGMNDIVEKVVLRILNSETGFKLSFSEEKFAGHKFTLDRKDKKADGYWYYSRELKLMGWFGPELNGYFPEFPNKIFANYEPIES